MGFEFKRYNSKSVEDGVRRKLRNAMNVATEEAADAMREVIATDMLTDASRKRGGGRKESGDMLADVKSSKVRITDSGKSYQSFWGWSTADRKAHSDRILGGVHDDSGKEVKSYYDLQDWGFQARQYVPGMHSQEAARRKYREVMKREWRR